MSSLASRVKALERRAVDTDTQASVHAAARAFDSLSPKQRSEAAVRAYSAMTVTARIAACNSDGISAAQAYFDMLDGPNYRDRQ